MKLYAPGYYPLFACIADRCRHTCCAGWEIDIDPTTYRAYTSLTADYGDAIRKSIALDDDGTPCFRLVDGERCPHLNEQGLCRIILTMGEESLCEICREHPRFYHTTAHGLEVGLGMACEEACRIILTSDDFADMVALGETESDASLPDFDVLPYRAHLYSLLSDASLPYDTRLARIADAYDVEIDRHGDSHWRALLSSLEYMDPENKDIYATCYTSRRQTPPALVPMLTRALAYLIFRHVSAADDGTSLREALGLCLFCERLLASVAAARGVNDLQGLIDCARTLSEELEYSEENTRAILDAAAAL